MTKRTKREYWQTKKGVVFSKSPLKIERRELTGIISRGRSDQRKEKKGKQTTEKTKIKRKGSRKKEWQTGNIGIQKHESTRNVGYVLLSLIGAETGKRKRKTGEKKRKGQDRSPSKGRVRKLGVTNGVSQTRLRRKTTKQKWGEGNGERRGGEKLEGKVREADT